MKRRTKRLLSIGLAAAMTVGLLAGCGKKGGADNGGNDEDGITTLKMVYVHQPGGGRYGQGD